MNDKKINYKKINYKNMNDKKMNDVACFCGPAGLRIKGRSPDFGSFSFGAQPSAELGNAWETIEDGANQLSGNRLRWVEIETGFFCDRQTGAQFLPD